MEKAARSSRKALARKNVVKMAIATDEDAGPLSQRKMATEPNADVAISERTAAKIASALVGERLRDSIRDA